MSTQGSDPVLWQKYEHGIWLDCSEADYRIYMQCGIAVRALCVCSESPSAFAGNPVDVAVRILRYQIPEFNPDPERVAQLKAILESPADPPEGGIKQS